MPVLLLHLICTVFVEFSFLKDLVVMIHLLVYHFQNHPCLYQSPSKRKYTPQEVHCIYYIDHLCQVHSLLALNQVILYQQFGLWQEDFICREFKSTKKNHKFTSIKHHFNYNTQLLPINNDLAQFFDYLSIPFVVLKSYFPLNIYCKKCSDILKNLKKKLTSVYLNSSISITGLSSLCI